LRGIPSPGQVPLEMCRRDNVGLRPVESGSAPNRARHLAPFARPRLEAPLDCKNQLARIVACGGIVTATGIQLHRGLATAPEAFAGQTLRGTHRWARASCSRRNASISV